MSKPARSVFIFGIYLLLLGAIMVIAPNVLLMAFGISPTQEVWIRIAGMVIGFLGCYYVLAARIELTDFFRWTIPVRASVVVFFIVFVLLGYVQPVLILFGVIDLAGALWTRRALRASMSAP